MKLICINDEFNNEARLKVKNLPKFGEVYTLRKARSRNNRVGFLLREITNPLIYVASLNDFTEPDFDSARFIEWDVDKLEREINEEKYETT